MTKKDNEVISFRISLRGDRFLWMKFINKVREDKQKKDKSLTAWSILKGFIEDYLKKS